MERMAQIAAMVTGVVLGVVALDAVASIFVPLVLALVVGVVLSPLSALWERLGLSLATGALLSLGLALLMFGLVAMLFQPLVAQIIAQAPKVWADMQSNIAVLRGMLQNITRLSQDVTEAMTSGAAPTMSDGSGVTLPTVADALLLAPAFLGQFAIFTGALFFFMMTRKEIYTWVARHLSAKTDRAQTTFRLLAAEQQVSRYFLAITMVNAVLGGTLAIVLQIMGMPGALLWGVMAFLLNFIVYLGPAALVVGLLFAGVAAFDGVLSVVPAGLFLLLNGLEGQFVTPAVVGRQMSMNPLLVFMVLIFGIWLWGPVGGVVAIPLLVWVLVLNDAIDDPKA